MTIDERIRKLEKTLRFRRMAMSGLLCLVLAGGAMAVASNLMPPDPEAIKVTTKNASSADTTRIQISGNEDTAKTGFMNSNVGVGTATQFGGGGVVLGIANANTLPSTNPSGGGVAYSEGGRLKWRRSDGTIDTLGGGWELVAEVTAGADSSELAITTGLAGNTDKDYLFRARIVSKNTSGTSKNFGIRMNSDTGSNYLYTRVRNGDDAHANLGTLYWSAGVTQTFVDIASTSLNDKDILVQGWIRSDAGPGTHREVSCTASTFGERFQLTTGEWTNTSTEITALRLMVLEGTNSIGTGSTFSVWKRVR